MKKVMLTKYPYKKNDVFYNIEIMTNLVSLVQYYPNKKMLILSYLDDDKIIQTTDHLNSIRRKIYQVNPELADANIYFEDLSSVNSKNVNNKGELEGTFLTFARRYGIATEENVINCYNGDREKQTDKQAIHNGYYPIKETDAEHNEESDGLFFAYGLKNYQSVLLAKLFSMVNPSIYNVTTLPNRTAVEENEIVSRLIAEGKMKKSNSKIPKAETLSRFNDLIKSNRYKENMAMSLKEEMLLDEGQLIKAYYVRYGWLLTNRHIDIASLNEKQYKTPLRRLSGVLGLQMDDSMQLRGKGPFVDSVSDISELFAYNVSDVYGAKSLFEHNIYQNTFSLRKSLLAKYPQMIYEKMEDVYKPNVNPNHVKWNRITTSSTSQQFVNQIIAPYNKLKDQHCISFLYPEKSVAEKMGLQQIDVLEDTMKWAIENIPNGEKAFKPIYDFYKLVEGRNSNETITNEKIEAVYHSETKRYYPITKDRNIQFESANGQITRKFKSPLEIPTGYEIVNVELSKIHPFVDISEMQKSKNHNLNTFYKMNELDSEGNAIDSSCMVTFSNGGIHGQEIDKNYLERIMLHYKSLSKAIHMVKQDFNNNAEQASKDNASKYDVYLPTASNKKQFEWSKISSASMCRYSEENEIMFKDIEIPSKQEILFSYNPKTGWKLKKDFVFTSTGKANHQDFTNYYPLLLSMLAVFKNEEMGEDEDPYYDIYLSRQENKRYKHEKEIQLFHLKKEKAENNIIEETQNEFELLDLLQNGEKFVLNAGTGAGDAKFDSNIRKNNAIVSMRIIGQLFSWRIGQAQTLAGARITSTNTDGLYTMDIDEETNNRILMDIVKNMHVKIEPETIDNFITKDSNNRIEYNEGEIVTAKGIALSAYKGSSPNQSLNHPSICDRILAEYLTKHPRIPVNEPFDRAYAKDLLLQFLSSETPETVLKYFQWIISAKEESGRYPFIRLMKERPGDNNEVDYVDTHGEFILAPYNRIFLVKRANDGRPFPTIESTAVRVNTKQFASDPIAVRMLAQYGYILDTDNHKEAYLTKVVGMPNRQSIYIENRNISLINEKDKIIEALDLDTYIDMIEKTFTNSWLNYSMV